MEGRCSSSSNESSHLVVAARIELGYSASCPGITTYAATEDYGDFSDIERSEKKEHGDGSEDEEDSGDMGKSRVQNEQSECSIDWIEEAERVVKEEEGLVKLDCHGMEVKGLNMKSRSDDDDGTKTSSPPLEDKIDLEWDAHHSPNNMVPISYDETLDQRAYLDEDNGVIYDNHRFSLQIFPSVNINDQPFQSPCVKRRHRKLSKVLEESESFMKKEFGSSSLEAISYMNCRGNGWKSIPTSSSSSSAIKSRSLSRMVVLLLLRRGMSDGALLREKSSRNPKKNINQANSHHPALDCGNGGGGECKQNLSSGSGTRKRMTTTTTLGGFLWPLKKVRDIYVSWMMGLDGGTNICSIANSLASHHHYFPTRLD